MTKSEIQTLQNFLSTASNNDIAEMKIEAAWNYMPKVAKMRDLTVAVFGSQNNDIIHREQIKPAVLQEIQRRGI